MCRISIPYYDYLKEYDGKYLTTIRWSPEDLDDVFSNEGIEFNDENVKIFKQYGAETLLESSVSFGWDVIDDILDNMISAGHFIKPCDGWVKMPDSNCFVAKKSERIYTV